jgi:hypothetical protein
MEAVAKTLVVALAAAILLFGLYVGIRTIIKPVWFVRWRNRLNGDPRDYPIEWRSQSWAQWNMAMWDPDRVRTGEMRGFGIVIAALSTIFLVSLLVLAY